MLKEYEHIKQNLTEPGLGTYKMDDGTKKSIKTFSFCAPDLDNCGKRYLWMMTRCGFQYSLYNCKLDKTVTGIVPFSYGVM
jgi:hypothetical protein